MTADLDFIELVTAVLGSHVTWSGLAAVLVLVFAYRWARGDSPAKILGFRNGYTKEATFLASVEDIKDLINEKAEAEGKRMDKHGKEIGELRHAVQDIDRKVAKLDGQMEQFRNK